MGVVAEKSDFDREIWLAERLRRAQACREMASVLRTVGRQASVPDTKWMADVAAEELAMAAARLCDRSSAPRS